MRRDVTAAARALALAVVALLPLALAGCDSSRRSAATPNPTVSTPTTSAPTTPATSTPTPSSSMPTSTTSPGTATASASALPAASALRVAPGRVGLARVGMTKVQALATGYFDADAAPAATGCRVAPLRWKRSLAEQLDVSASRAGDITSIGVRGAGPRTGRGLGVGSTLAQISSVYETAQVREAGYGQTGVFVSDGTAWLGFLIATPVANVERSDKVTFMEVTSGAAPTLIRSGC